MGNLHLVTGYAGSSHVTAEDHASMFEAAIRSGEYVMNAGTCFAATIIDNNTIRIGSGELMMQGRHVKLGAGKTVDVTVENGALGMNRIDYIVVRYTRNTDDGVEACNLAVLKGTPVASNPVVPRCTTGDINGEKALVNEFPLYKVSVSGLTLGEPVALFTPKQSLAEELRKFCIESTDAPGCYYRVCDSRTEWINPPMFPNMTYRTTERWGGKPVYTERVDLFIAAGSSSSFSLPSMGEVISAELRYLEKGVWLDVSNNPAITVEATLTSMRTSLKVSSTVSVDIIAVFKYTGITEFAPT